MEAVAPQKRGELTTSMHVPRAAANQPQATALSETPRQAHSLTQVSQLAAPDNNIRTDIQTSHGQLHRPSPTPGARHCGGAVSSLTKCRLIAPNHFDNENQARRRSETWNTPYLGLNSSSRQSVRIRSKLSRWKGMLTLSVKSSSS
jgi:hypothetical protein